jgi:hypothetical protein
LKYADFGLSRVEGEILEELFEKFADAGEMWSTEADVEENPLSKKYKTTGKYTTLFYSAAEIYDSERMMLSIEFFLCFLKWKGVKLLYVNRSQTRTHVPDIFRSPHLHGP